jgi:hypothetical protein
MASSSNMYAPTRFAGLSSGYIAESMTPQPDYSTMNSRQRRNAIKRLKREQKREQRGRKYGGGARSKVLA